MHLLYLVVVHGDIRLRIFLEMRGNISQDKYEPILFSFLLLFQLFQNMYENLWNKEKIGLYRVPRKLFRHLLD